MRADEYSPTLAQARTGVNMSQHAENLTVLSEGISTDLLTSAQTQAMLISCKEIYGLLLIPALLFLLLLLARAATKLLRQ